MACTCSCEVFLLGHGFDDVGIMELAASKKSLKITLNDLPYTTFTHVFYVSAKNVEAVLNGHKKNVTIVMIAPKKRNESGESHRS